jgi:hypothetical protein
MITTFLNKPFPYLDSLRFRLIHVGIIMAYSVFFMVAFNPFDFNAWLSHGWIELAGLGILGSVPIAISQLLVRPLIRIKSFEVKHFIIWFISELILLTIFMSILYSDPDYSFFDDLRTTFKYTTLIAFLPYSFSILIIVLIQLNKEKSIKKALTSDDIDLVSFKDEREQVKFSVKSNDILYIESTDNYVTVFFSNEDEGKLNKQMIRTSLKKVEEAQLSSKLLRCHRSFMVNLENVLWMKKEGRNFVLKVKSINSFIPVSRSYIPQFKSLLQ